MFESNVARIVYLVGGIAVLGIVILRFVEIEDIKNVIDNLLQMRSIKM